VGVFLIKLLLFLAPSISALWQDDGIKLSVPTDSIPSELYECLKSGIGIRVRFRYQICGANEDWRDRCRSEKVEIRTVSFEPISGRVLIESDRLFDQLPPNKVTLSSSYPVLSSLQSATKVAFTTLPIHSRELVDDDFQFLKRKGLYLKAKASAYCDGDRTILTRFAEIITLGLIDSPGMSTNWERFALSRWQDLAEK
jgi:hypothetical protein